MTMKNPWKIFLIGLALCGMIFGLSDIRGYR